MKLDRALQRSMLTELCNLYPDIWHPRMDALGADEEVVMANLQYLADHGLITLHAQRSIEGAWLMSGAQATHHGCDFMADDGGLSAILGVVTVRLHDDTVKSLIEARIHAADLPEPEKQRYLDQLREMPAETTKHLVLKLVDLGLEKGPQAIGLIGKWLGLGQG